MQRDHYFDKLTGIEKACQLFKNGPDRADAEHLLSLMRVENDSDFQDLAAV